MLTLGRRKQEGLVALLDETTLLQLLAEVRETGEPVLFRYGPVEIEGSRIRIGTHAPPAIKVDRDEIFVRKHGITLLPFSELREKHL